MKTQYKLVGRFGGQYAWLSTTPVGDRYDLVHCGVRWFRKQMLDGSHTRAAKWPQRPYSWGSEMLLGDLAT